MARKEQQDGSAQYFPRPQHSSDWVYWYAPGISDAERAKVSAVSHRTLWHTHGYPTTGAQGLLSKARCN